MKKIISLCLAAFLTLGLCACGNDGMAAEKPVTLSSASAFNRWFGEGKKLSKKSGETVYFQLTDDIKLKKEGLITGGNDVHIDLNGHTLTGEENRAFSVTGGKLTLHSGKVETAGAPENGGVIKLDGEGSVLNLQDAILSVTDDSGVQGVALGGVLHATDGEIHVRGASELHGSTSGLRRSGGAVALTGASKMYLYEGSVQDGKAGTGGNILVDGQSALYLLGGKVENGAAIKLSDITGYGGNVYVQGMGSCYIRGGRVAGGTAEKDGGNIYLANAAGETAGLYLLSGIVENGTAKESGGNLYALDKASAVRIYGGEMGGGNAIFGGSIYLKSAPMELWNGTLTGVAGNEEMINGGVIYGDKAQLRIYGGTVTSGMTMEQGGNIYVTDSQVEIYGGAITAGAVVAADVTRGGGNLYAGRESTVKIYGGEISGGISNCKQDSENSAAGANVMIAGTTVMEMFGGNVKNGMVYGSITRGGSVYVYGQAKRSNVVFHFYGGLIENDLLDNKMRGMCIGSYSETKGDSGHAVTRIFGGEYRFTGDAGDQNKVYTIHGNKNGDIYLFDATAYEGTYSRTVTGACPDPTHNTHTGDVAAGCLTQGCTQYTCNTCGVWYAITAEPAGHTETSEPVDIGVKHSCATCEAVWYTEE